VIESYIVRLTFGDIVNAAMKTSGMVSSRTSITINQARGRQGVNGDSQAKGEMSEEAREKQEEEEFEVHFGCWRSI